MNAAPSSPQATPFFSVCIPVYNGEKFIRKAIDSVIGQSFTDWELVIVEDRGQDRTWEILQEYRDHPKIKIHRNEKNLGQGANFNRCLDHASGCWMGLLAADDAYEPHALETIHRAIIEHQNLLLCVHAHSSHGEETRISRAFPDARTFEARKFAELLYTRGGIFGEISNFFFNLNAYRLKPTFRFTENFIHIDGHFWMQLMLTHPEGQAYYTPEVLTNVLIHEESLSSQHSKGGNDIVVLYQATELSASLGWSPLVQLRQIARIFWIGFKYFSILPPSQKLRAFYTSWLILSQCLPHSKASRD